MLSDASHLLFTKLVIGKHKQKSPENVYGVDGERLKEIRFLSCSFLLHKHTLAVKCTIPYEHYHIISQKRFSVIQFHFTWFSLRSFTLLISGASCGSVLSLRSLRTHSRTCRWAMSIFSSSRLHTKPLLLLGPRKNKRRNIWFREG